MVGERERWRERGKWTWKENGGRSDIEKGTYVLEHGGDGGYWP